MSKFIHTVGKGWGIEVYITSKIQIGPIFKTPVVTRVERFLVPPCINPSKPQQEEVVTGLNIHLLMFELSHTLFR